MTFDHERFHRRSVRLKGYDYSKAGHYFVTICSRNRECIFAKFYSGVEAGLAPTQISVPNSFPIFRLTEIGKIIEKNWRDIAIKNTHVTVDDFVIMPNHIHGILIVDQKNGALGQIIGSFKSRCVVEYMKYCLKENDGEIWKPWQRNFYEHIIRDERELTQIRKYILENPIKWLEDENNPINIENNQKIGRPQGVPLKKIETSY